MKNGTFYEKMGQLLATNVCEKILVFSSEKIPVFSSEKIDAKQNIAHRFFEHQTPQTIHFLFQNEFSR